MNEMMTKTNEKILVKMDYFAKYGETKMMTVWNHKFSDKKYVKIRGKFFFVAHDGGLYL